MMKSNYLSLWVLLSLILIIGSVTQAQRLCEALVENALQVAENNCQTIENGQACYGYDSLSSTFFDELDENPMLIAGGFIDLPVLQSIQSMPFDSEEDEWGVGYFRLNANDTSDESVRIIILGDVLLENAVSPDDGDDVNAFEEIYVVTGGQSDCQEAVNDMIVQTPEGIPFALTINGVPVQMGSTVVFGFDRDGGTNIMYIAVLDGKAIIYPESSNAVEVAEGKVAVSAVEVTDGEEGITVDVSGFSEVESLTTDGEGFRNLAYYTTVSNLPVSLLNYEIELPQETGGEFTVTLTNCVSNGGSYQETWQVSNAPAGAANLVFVGSTEKSVAPSDTVIISQSSPTQYVYAFAPAGVVEAREVFNTACAVSDVVQPTTAPDVVQPTIAPVVQPTIEPVTSGCSQTLGNLAPYNFVNNSGGGIEVYWINFECGWNFYGIIEPGQAWVQESYPGHEWVFVQGGATVKSFTVMGSGGTYSYP